MISSDTQEIADSITHMDHPQPDLQALKRRFEREAPRIALAVLFALSVSLQAQNPNNYDSSKIIQEMRHPHSDLVIVAAHRGLHATAPHGYGTGLPPENSLNSIGGAAQAGSELIEVDIKLTIDNVPILSHDVTLGREALCPGCTYEGTFFNPFAPKTPSQQQINPEVGVLTLSEAKQFTLWNYPYNPHSTAIVPTLQDVLDYIKANRIAAVLTIDIKDDATAQACWRVVKANTDYNGHPYSQSVVFKMPGSTYPTAQAFAQAFGSDYTSVLLWPFYGTALISPSALAIDDSYGTDSSSLTGFGSEINIIASLNSLRGYIPGFVASEVNIKQGGGILTQVLSAAKTNLDGSRASVGSFNPIAEHLDTFGDAEFFNAAGPNAGYCCYKLSDLYYNGAPNGQPSDTADNRGDLNFLLANGDNIITTDEVGSVTSTLAELGKRNISYLQGSTGAQRSIVPLRVMPIGDSITEGYQSSPGQFGNGYRYPLQQDIQNMGQMIQFVGDQSDGTMNNPQNEGFSAKEIAYIASQAVPSAASWRPNVALILAGTNDVNGNDDIANAPGRLDSMINGLFNSAPDATMLVAGLPPSFDTAFNSNLQAFNVSVRALVSQRQNSGQHVEYVDMSNLDPNADKADALHPNPAGYQIMGNNFASAIEDVMNKGWVTNAVAITRTPGGGGGHGNGAPKPPLGTAAWQNLGPIAGGIGTPARSITIMADLNGDGRADYLSVEPNGSVYGYLNGGANPAGGWVWLPQPEITSGGGALGNQVRFADINGDGRADFLAVAQNGSVTGYLNGGVAADGTWVWLPTTVHPGADGPGDEIQFADVNGDGKADYLIIDRKTGAVTIELNLGGGNWGPATIVASGTGAPAGSKVMFADINGDGFADYLTISSINGTVTAYMNGGVKADGTLNLYNVGQVAPGVGAPSLDLAVIFADLDGDGVADYFAVNRNTGGLNVFLTKGLDTATVSNWIPLGQIAAGEGGPNIQIQFADIDGDGRADYLAVNTLNGSVNAYLSGGLGNAGWNWNQLGLIQPSGVNAVSGSTYRFADVDGDGKADYLVVGLYNTVDAYKNNYSPQGSFNWYHWGPIYPGSSTWAGFGTAANVHFADINGDKLADLVVDDGNGNAQGLLNAGPNTGVDAQSGGWFNPDTTGLPYTFAYGTGAGGNITFANIDIGNKQADYMVIGNGGSVTAFLNAGFAGNTGSAGNHVTYRPVGSIAAGEAPSGSSVIMADINGDGRADYLVVNNTTGAVTAWLNNGPY